ncbi:D-alanyl-D-alanine carboxypeptidase family protein [Maricaulis sp.]|uniref:D-alanyl-D-alanine carboxypeptidase family protein n=1 Tax=Maricaulis sp. TaxID=1486257 RepID=UPI0026219A58|nr:D-alanyl-D-alanine carboxypeptidase family protein [Maricaulis sp.]MDF1767185.1 D-alanyl-D-alanine carboxypeptidase [Maricaulis sp.]
MRAFSALAFFFSLVITAPLQAQNTYQTEASHAAILDVETGEILYALNGDEAMPPASMSKMMTVLMVVEALEAGSLSLDDELPVSEHAWRTGGAASGSSTMFLEVNSRARVEDLLRGVIIQSGNDACIVLAEAIGGTEAAFADMMTDRAHELGLTSASFANATGWPDPDHRISAIDLARLARLLIEDHPEYYGIWAEREFTYNGIRQYNRNPLLGVFSGADGLKTGHTEESGYGLVGSAERDGERRIIVFNGMGSNAARATEAERMMRAALSDYSLYHLFAAGDDVDHRAEVFMGDSDTVSLRVADDVTAGLHRRARRDLTVTVSYDGPLVAPIQEGDVVGTLIVEAPDYEAREYDLLAAESVSEKGLMGRIGAAIAHMLRG